MTRVLTFEIRISIPIGAASIAIVLVFLHLPIEKQDIKTKIMRIDFTGAYHYHRMASLRCSLNYYGCAGCALVLCAATLLLLAINFGGRIRTWGWVAVLVSIHSTRK